MITVCGLLLLLISGVAAAEAAVTDSPIVISKVAADGGRLTVTLLNTAPFPVAIGGWTIAAGGARATLPTGTVLGGFARSDVPMARPAGGDAFTMALATPDGGTVQLLEDPAHVWVAGDVFSLHGVDRYRYVVVYTRDTADGLVHGCYEVDQADSGRYEVSQYVHGQEVFGDAFLAEQGARFLANVPLNEVVITDDTPGNDGQSYFGMTLGSIFGGANAPSPTATPEPVPTAPPWPTLTPTQATPTPTAAPTGVVSVTRTPGPEPTVPGNASPIPMPTVTSTAAQPIVTEPTPVAPTGTPVLVPGAAPVLEPTPEPAVTSAPTRTWGKRFATWQAPSTTGRRVSAAVTPEATVTTGSRATRAVRTFGRVYPRWSTFGRSTA